MEEDVHAGAEPRSCEYPHARPGCDHGVFPGRSRNENRFAGGNRGGWVLDEAGAAIVHVAGADQVFPGDQHKPFTAQSGSGAIDHVALRCSGYDGIKARLKAMQVPFWENHVARARLRQIFVEEPTGITLELGFPES